jgi:hypothetical protein
MRPGLAPLMLARGAGGSTSGSRGGFYDQRAGQNELREFRVAGRGEAAEHIAINGFGLELFARTEISADSRGVQALV